MNFMNRKLFKGRAARDKLNKMGGIMASSQPLMQTVQNFQVGGNVRTRYVPGQGYPPRPIPGTRPTVLGFGPGDLPTATDIMQSGLGQFISKNLPTAANARRKMTSIQEFLKPVRTTVGDFMTERDQRRAGGIETMRGPTAEDLKPVLPLTASEEALQAGQIPTMRGPTAEDIQEKDRAITNQIADSIVGDYGQSTTEVQIGQSTAPPATGDADAEVEPEFESAMSISEQVDTATGKTKTATQVAKIQTGTTAEKKEATETLGQQLIRQVEEGNFDQAEDTIAEAYGLTEDEIERKTEDEIAKMQGIISKVLGVDPEKYKQDRGLALAMAGFKFAQTGDIGEAGAQFTKEITRLRQADQARQDRVDSLAISTVLGREDKESDRKFARDMKRIDQAHDFRKIGKMQSFELKKLGAEIDFKTYINDTNNALKLNLKNKDIDIVNARLQADMDNLITRLDRQEEIAKDDRSSREDIAKANNEAANIRAEMSGLGDATKLAMIEGKQRGLTGTELTDFISTRSKDLATTDILTGPDSLRRLITVTAPKIMDEENVAFGEATQKIIDAITSTPELQAIYGTDLEQLGITGSQASGGKKVGDIITQGGGRYRVTAVDADGNPTAADAL